MLSASAATLDWLLKPVRATVASRHKRRRRLSRGRNIRVRTVADWNRPPPGSLEVDLVAHCGDSMWGSFIYNLVATDVCTGWTEAVPLLVREQHPVVAGLETISKHLPFPALGIDSGNDPVFINDTLTQYPVLRRPGHRVHPFPGLPQVRSGLGGAENGAVIRRSWVMSVTQAGCPGRPSPICTARCGCT